MEFSRLDDTRFPNWDTTAPYAIRNTFDYTRWVPDTRVHLVNVLWNADYSNVVKFESDAARDAWFDAIEDSFALTLKSNARIVPDGTVKLPLPYDVAARYNYLYVDIPVATSDDAMIQDETTSGVRRWFFFVGDISYSAPNTTIVTVTPDVWTNFINETRITYMMLQRGHAPVAASDTDAYLANPIANNRYLLAPDVNYDDSDVVRSSKFVPFGNGTKYVCLASTVGYMQIQRGETGTMGTGSTWGTPTFSDTSDWYGYQLQVNGYGYGDGSDYSNLRACVNQYNRPGNIIPNNLDIYAVRADDAEFLRDVIRQSPAFMQTIKAMFVVDEAMISRDVELEFCGHTMWFCSNTDRTLADYELTRDMFGFDEDEQRFAKLYTYPYSRLEVSDNQGRTVEVRIEDTGRIGVRVLTSVLFPVLNLKVFLTGINGVGAQSYTWRNLGQDELAKEVPTGDWDKAAFELGIPTYAVYIDGGLAHMLSEYNGMQNAREQALTAYHNSVRSANGAYTNAMASAQNSHDCQVNEADTAQTNAKASAATANANAVASANTAQTNANAMAGTTQTNTNNAAQCSFDNVALTIAANSANTKQANSSAQDIMMKQNSAVRDNTEETNTINAKTTQEENQVSIATTRTSGIASIVTGGLTGATSAGMSTGSATMAVVGGIVGAAKEGISTYAAMENAMVTTQASSELTNLTNASNLRVQTTNADAARASQIYAAVNKDHQTDNTNQCLDGQRTNNKNTANTNSANLYATQTANSARTRNTDVSNAGRTLTTSNENADRTRNTAVGNAGATLATSNANSTRTRQVSILNAQETLTCAQDSQRNAWLDATRGTPVQLCAATGDGEAWAFGQVGVQFRLRTQSDSAIAQTAAQFARFGYALNQVWDVARSGLCLMRHFTYWKAADVWVDVRDVASSQVGDMIADMFQAGVTVWGNPDEIGKVGVYDN